MDNLWNAVLGKVDGQIRVFWNLKVFIYPSQPSTDPFPCLSVHTTSVGSLAVLDRSRDVDEEKVAPRTCLMRDCLAYDLPACLVRRDWRRDNRCASSRQFRRDERYSLQVIVALFPSEGMVSEKVRTSTNWAREPGYLVRGHFGSNRLVTGTRSDHLVR